jgi:hypothetical protein
LVGQGAPTVALQQGAQALAHVDDRMRPALLGRIPGRALPAAAPRNAKDGVGVQAEQLGDRRHRHPEHDRGALVGPDDAAALVERLGALPDDRRRAGRGAQGPYPLPDAGDGLAQLSQVAQRAVERLERAFGLGGGKAAVGQLADQVGRGLAIGAHRFRGQRADRRRAARHRQEHAAGELGEILGGRRRGAAGEGADTGKRDLVAQIRVGIGVGLRL